MCGTWVSLSGRLSVSNRSWNPFGGADQYVSVRFTESLALHGLSASVGSVGDAYNNALAESLIGLFKTEVVNRHGPFKTLTEVEFALMEWVDWYNNARLHSRLDYLTPAEYETDYYAQQLPRRPALV
ncbi:transposase [Nocardia takedensis]|uniref:transposase n=1 Tax=Nocardia takedensis TaxID=259390 RepID=UPI003F777C6B